MQTSKTSAAIGAVTDMSTCEVRIGLRDGTNSSRLERDVVRFAEYLHRNLGIQVSVARCITATATVLLVWSGAADSSYVPATDIASVDF